MIIYNFREENFRSDSIKIISSAISSIRFANKKNKSSSSNQLQTSKSTNNSGGVFVVDNTAPKNAEVGV